MALAADVRRRSGSSGRDVDAEDLSALAYTGGTTGKPKGVMNTYRGSAAMAQIMVSEWQWPDEVRHLVCTPLSHAGSSLFVPLLLRGGSMVVLPGFRGWRSVLEAIERHRITTTMLVPSMIYALLDHPRFAQTDLSSLQTIFYGASPMSRPDSGRRSGILGPIFFQFYGQTECPQTVCVLRKEEHDPDDLDRLASCGRPVPWVRVGLLDDDGNEVPKGQPGELCVTRPPGDEGLLEQAAKRQARRSKAAGSTPATSRARTRTGFSPSSTARRT